MLAIDCDINMQDYLRVRKTINMLEWATGLENEEWEFCLTYGGYIEIQKC